MKLLTRLKIISIIPSLLLLGVALFLLYDSLSGMAKTQGFQTALQNNAFIDKALLEIGKERGLSALYLASGKESYAQLLVKQRRQTDEAVRQLKTQLQSQTSGWLHLFSGNELDAKSYKTMIDTFDRLNDYRVAVDAKKKPFETLILEGYTRGITRTLLKNLRQPEHFVISSDISDLAHLMERIYISQEYTGLTRDYIAYYLEKKIPLKDRDIVRWNDFHAKSMQFDPDLIFDPRLTRLTQSVFANTHMSALLKNMGRDYRLIVRDASNGNYTLDPIDWFALMTKRILVYAQLERNFHSVASDLIQSYLTQKYLNIGLSLALVLLALLVLYLGYRSAHDVTTNIRQLEFTLKRTAEDFEDAGDEYESIMENLKSVNFETTEGINEAYHILQELVEQARNDRKKAVEQSEAKSLFLANMSHEIRTPMNGIIGFTELLKNTQLPPEQQEYTNIIDKSSQNLLGIINNLLDLAKIESQNVEVENVIFDTHQEFDDTIDSFGVSAAEKGLELNYYIDPEIAPKLKGDPTKIKEILTNLLGNAVKFTDKGGEIDVEIAKGSKTKTGKTLLVVTVRDTGIGMNQDQIERIFQPFAQADASITRKYGGTGLGLTITKEYIELLGGELQVKSEPSKGTEFRFTLPVEEVPVEAQDYRGRFKKLRLCRVVDGHTSRFYDYLKRYADYFGIEMEDIPSGAKLLQEINAGQCSHALIDLDAFDENQVRQIENIDPDKLIVFTHVTRRGELDDLSLPKEMIVTKPVTWKKLVTLFSTLAKFEKSEQSPTEPTIKTVYTGKVLVTEDNVINQKLVKNILEGFGLEVDIANNGLEALEKRKKNDYDLIFMDIQMPVMDGVEATHQILDYEKKYPDAGHIPIVALTANALKGDRERFLNEGMDEYVSKPIEISELVYILNKFLKDKQHIEVSNPVVQKKNDEHTEDVSTAAQVEGKGQETTETTESDTIEPIAPLESAPIVIAKNLPFTRKILAKILDNLKLPYSTVENPDALLRLLEAHSPKVILADEGMITPDVKKVLDEKHIDVIFTNKPETNRFTADHYHLFEGKLAKEDFEHYIHQFVKGNE